MIRSVLTGLLLMISVHLYATSILVPMDETQANHLKAYGLAFKVLKDDKAVDWLLNYRGGSFLFEYSESIRNECTVRGVSFEVISAGKVNSILAEINNPEINMNLVRLEKSPRIAVYSPKNDLILDETDAVILVLDYAEIPYTIIYDEEILKGELAKFDWVHLHHEDFTGQVGRFSWRQSNIIESKVQEVTAHHLGYAKVSEMKLDVAKKIKTFCASGGYLFAMCSGAETFDIALAADGIDIVAMNYDGDDIDPAAQDKLDFSKTLAFENFTLEMGESRRFSDINMHVRSGYFDQSADAFLLFEYSAKWDIVPTMLNQNHTNAIHEFFGQTTAFNKFLVKPSTVILGENRKAGNVRYIYGELGTGHWTFYSGHDPEGTPGRGSRNNGTDLSLFPHSPGYRLILNNVLFPSAKKKKQKT